MSTHKWLRLCVLLASVVIVLPLPGVSEAQEPTPAAADPERPARKVADTKFWLTAATLNVAMIADTKTTFDVMRRCDVCYEVNPYAAPFIARGPVVAFTAGAAFDVGVMVVADKMKGSERALYRRTWWVIPVALTAGHVLACRHNLGVAR
jgi:hypothetical protein